jgi:hypothetical protein
MSGQGQMPQGNNGGQQLNQWAEDFYIYLASFGNLAPGGSNTQNIQIQSDSNFEWIECSVYGNLHGATPPFLDNILLPINIMVVDSGSSRQLFSAPTPVNMFAGTGKQVFILPVTRLFQARSNIQVTAQNFDATSTFDNIAVAFIGRKLFNLGAT